MVIVFRILELLFYELFSRIVNRILGIISHWVRIFRIRTCTRNVLFFFCCFCFFFFLNVDFLIGFVSRIYVMRRWIYIFSTLIFAQYKLIDIIIILLLDLRRHRTLPCVQMWIRLWKGVFKVSPKRFYLSCSSQNLIREFAPKTATAAKTSL